MPAFRVSVPIASPCVRPRGVAGGKSHRVCYQTANWLTGWTWAQPNRPPGGLWSSFRACWWRWSWTLRSWSRCHPMPGYAGLRPHQQCVWRSDYTARHFRASHDQVAGRSRQQKRRHFGASPTGDSSTTARRAASSYVWSHRKWRLMARLSVVDLPGLVRFAWRNGLISLEGHRLRWRWRRSVRFSPCPTPGHVLFALLKTMPRHTLGPHQPQC